MKVLVACEFSGRIRDAFRILGHDAWSCDLLPSEGKYPQYHIQYDCLAVIHADGPWDLMIAHPPCTHLAVSGARWFDEKLVAQDESIEFVKKLLRAPIPRIALENPVGILSREIRKPDQIVHPHYFGDPEQKATCWWLKNLPKLKPTNMIALNEVKQSCFRAAPSPDRWKVRSRTYPGMAVAIAIQWGDLGPL